MANSSINKTRKLCETAIMLALATALSYVTIFKLPMGGSITLFSQVFRLSLIMTTACF